MLRVSMPLILIGVRIVSSSEILRRDKIWGLRIGWIRYQRVNGVDCDDDWGHEIATRDSTMARLIWFDCNDDERLKLYDHQFIVFISDQRQKSCQYIHIAMTVKLAWIWYEYTSLSRRLGESMPSVSLQVRSIERPIATYWNSSFFKTRIVPASSEALQSHFTFNVSEQFRQFDYFGGSILQRK